MWRTTRLQCVETVDPAAPDDDTSLYRLFGFSIFVSIRFRKRAVFGRLRKHHTSAKKALYRVQLDALKTLVESDKTVLPACIKYQDRGKMLFPCRNMIRFGRNSSSAIKSHLNPGSYGRLGRSIAKVVKRSVLSNQDLLQEFKMLLAYNWKRDAPEDIAEMLCHKLLSRVINTMLNSFFQCQEILDRIDKNKGVDAQVSLRDKLKVYADASYSGLQL